METTTLILIIILYSYSKVLDETIQILKNCTEKDINVFKEWKDMVDTEILESLNRNICDKELKEMCMYPMEGGKRLRSAILLSIAGVSSPSLKVCVGIEYLQAGSLIFDDIMDDDDYRHNKLSVYKKYGHTLAQLVGLKLFGLSTLEIHQGIQEYKPKNVNDLLFVSSKLSESWVKLISGQYKDLMDNTCDIKKLFLYKTCPMFQLPYTMGWLLSGNDLTSITEIDKLGELFGILYQIYDDHSDTESDKKKGSRNIFNEWGKDATMFLFKETMNEFVTLSKKHNLYNNTIQQLVYLLNTIE